MFNNLMNIYINNKQITWQINLQMFSAYYISHNQNRFQLPFHTWLAVNGSILCLIPKSTVTSLTAPKDTLQGSSLVRQSQDSNPGILFEGVRKYMLYACDNMHLPVEYALTSRSFLRKDKV